MEDITLEEVLKMVTFERTHSSGKFVVQDVNCSIWGNVSGSIGGNVSSYIKGNVSSIFGNVRGNVGGNVGGDVEGNVERNVRGNVGGSVFGNVEGDVGNVKGTINGRDWQYIETPREKAIRLIREGKGEEAIQVLQEGE